MCAYTGKSMGSKSGSAVAQGWMEGDGEDQLMSTGFLSGLMGKTVVNSVRA